MIVSEFFMERPDGVRLIRTYSNTNMMIHQLETNNIYSEAIDTEPVRFTYEETNIPVEPEESTPSSVETEKSMSDENLRAWQEILP